MEKFDAKKVQIESTKIECKECKSDQIKIVPLVAEGHDLKEVLIYCLMCNKSERIDYKKYLKEMGLPQ